MPTPNEKSILAWHFVGDTLRDGRPIPKDGEWLEHEGSIKICKSGLHASRRLIDALEYSPGATICRVRCKGVLTEHPDKLVCRSRRIVWRVDADDLLRDFARWSAWQVIDKWDAPGVVREYLSTGDPSKRDAAGAAAWDAAWAAAGAAARAAAWAAAGAAARAAARAAAGAAANKQLTLMVEQAHRGEYQKWLADGEVAAC